MGASGNEDPEHQHRFDPREGSGDPRTDPAALGELQAEEPDGDGGAVPPGAPAAEAPPG